jgi:hypothetical protein
LLTVAREKKGKGDEPKRGNVLSLTSPHRLGHELGTICVLRRRQLGALAELANQLFERFGLGVCLARLVTGAQDFHGRAVEIRSGIVPKEIREGDEGEAILSRKWVAALIWVWPMRPLLDTDVKRQREGREGESEAVSSESKTGRDSEVDPCLARV